MKLPETVRRNIARNDARRAVAAASSAFRDKLKDAAAGEVVNVPSELAAETFAPLDQIAPLLKTRGSSHGNWKDQAALSQNIKTVLGIDTNPNLRPDERESLEMIAVKLSRILTGDPHFEDHWRDIAGYATLAADLNKAA